MSDSYRFLTETTEAENLEASNKNIYLLLAAIGKTLSVCESIGCRYILVDSKKTQLASIKKRIQKNEFKLVEKYKNRGFIPMYLNMQPIIAEINFEKNH
ncbi:MAG: hypothetical protein NHB15_09500 [Methanosarcina barkeri]|nr:hypothetical protein [Methanosarcina sp. ERenArc_MAG2]